LKLNDELEQTILFSSHITTDVERVAADVAILHKGSIIYHGSVDALKERVCCLFLRADELPNVDNLIEGFISSRIDGSRLQIWVENWDEEKEQRLSDRIGAPVHSECVGLEELFMGMTS
jgi:ABC-2 type transport system ATP-binding protein